MLRAMGVAVASGLASVGGITSAHAQEAQVPERSSGDDTVWPIYVGLRGFIDFSEGLKFPSEFSDKSVHTVLVNHSSSIGGELSVGLRIPILPFRAEFSLGYRSVATDMTESPGLPTTDAGGSTSMGYAHTSLWYEINNIRFPLIGGLSIAIGGGGGPSYVQVKPISFHDLQLPEQSKSIISYQGGVNVAVPIGRHWEVTADYRIFTTGKFKLSATGSRGTTHLEGHSAGLGFRYSI